MASNRNACDEAVCDAGVDVAGMVLRVRRKLDLSQRELARRLGIGNGSIARIEASQVTIRVAEFERVLALAGMRLVVLDEGGREVAPVPEDVLRDNAGRRMPAHLDVRAPDDPPRSKLTDVRYDRAAPNGWYHHRARRDERRSRLGLTEGDDQPTVSALVDAARHRRRERLARARERARREPITLDDCRCSAACWETGECVEGCGCECAT